MSSGLRAPRKPNFGPSCSAGLFLIWTSAVKIWGLKQMGFTMKPDQQQQTLKLVG